jgi:hypothetical protein
MQILRLANISVQSGNQITNTVTETNFLDAVLVGPEINAGAGVGRLFKIKAFGYLSSLGASPGTWALKVKAGSTVLGTATVTLPNSLANAGWELNAFALVCATGASGKVSCQGFMKGDNAGTPFSAGMVNTGTLATGQITVNTGVSNTLQVSTKFSVADPANIVTLTQLFIEEWL